MMAKYPDELTCDMAETYGVFDIKRVPVKLLATLAVGLREDSRVKMAKRGALVDTKTILLAKLLDMLSGTASKLSEYGESGAVVNIADYLDSLWHVKSQNTPRSSELLEIQSCRNPSAS